MVGLAANHTRGHIVRAVLEGVAFSLRDSFTIFAELARARVERVRLGGGGARSPLWRQIQADMYGHPVETVAADEGAAYGAALLAGVGAGVWPSVDAACDALVTDFRRRHAGARTCCVMNERYDAYRRVYPALRAMSERSTTTEARLRQAYVRSIRSPPRAQVLLRPLDRRQSRPRSVRRRRAPAARRRSTRWRMLAEVGAWGVNLHDNDLVPIDATPADRDRIVKEFKTACERHGIVVPMATVNLFYDPVFRDGAFTANDPRVRAYARAEDACARWISAPSSARRSSCCGAGAKAPRPTRAGGPTRPSSDCAKRSTTSASTRSTAKYGFRFALEAKPNEPRGDIYMADDRRLSRASSPTLDHPEMVGVNPEVAHEQMAGLNFLHAVAQAWEAGKLFHIDLNDQVPGRYDQDFRFGSANLKAAFLLVKFLEDVGYDGPRHFDAHAYRTEDYDGVRDFARGCMRTYLILKERAARWNADAEIQALLQAAEVGSGLPPLEGYSPTGGTRCSRTTFDRGALAAKGLGYERLDQLTMEVLLGVR